MDQSLGVDLALVTFISGKSAEEILDATYNESDLLQDLERTNKLTQKLQDHYRQKRGGPKAHRYTRSAAFSYQMCHATEEGTKICEALKNMVCDKLDITKTQQVKNYVE